MEHLQSATALVVTVIISWLMWMMQTEQDERTAKNEFLKLFSIYSLTLNMNGLKFKFLIRADD